MDRREFLAAAAAVPLAGGTAQAKPPDPVVRNMLPGWSRKKVVEAMVANQRRHAPEFAAEAELFWRQTHLHEIVSVQPLAELKGPVYHLGFVSKSGAPVNLETMEANPSDLCLVIKSRTVRASGFLGDPNILEEAPIRAMLFGGGHRHVRAGVGDDPEEMYIGLLAISTAMNRRTLRGGANWVIANPADLPLVRRVPGFSAPLDYAERPLHYIGTLTARFRVFASRLVEPRTMLVGYKGDSYLDAGLVLAPQVHRMRATFQALASETMSVLALAHVDPDMWTIYEF